MELVKVEILGQVMTAKYGALSSGDILTTDPEFAKHLVQDCAAAKYVAGAPPAAAEAEADEKPSKGKKK